MRMGEPSIFIHQNMVVIGISNEFKIPVKYIGVGEKVEDLQVFNREAFVDTLFE